MFVRHRICYVRATEEFNGEYLHYLTNILLVIYLTDYI